MNRLILILLAGAALVLDAASAQSLATLFLVAEQPGRVVAGDSFVIALTNAVHIAHARDLIAREPALAGSTIVIADIAAGADGLNRNLRRSDAMPWSWHVTRVTSFDDITPEIYDGWPTFVKTDVRGWMQNTGGRIGFWAYTVVAELPLKPRITSIDLEASRQTTPATARVSEGSGTAPILSVRLSAVPPEPQVQVELPWVNPSEANVCPV